MDSVVSFRSDETNYGYPSVNEMIGCDQWLLVQLDQAGAPILNVIVSLFIKTTFLSEHMIMKC